MGSLRTAHEVTAAKSRAVSAAAARAITAATAKQRMLKLLVCSDAPEQALRYRGFRAIAGVDEVGRGALFGPVVAAAVILPERLGSLARAGLKDSKQLHARAAREAGPAHPQMRARHFGGGGGRRDHRPREHLPGHAHRHAGGGAGARARARPPADRRHAARSSVRADAAVLWRRALALDRRGVGGREGASRPADARDWTRCIRATGWPRTRATERRSIAARCANSARARCTAGRFAPVRALITGEPEVTGLLFDDPCWTTIRCSKTCLLDDASEATCEAGERIDVSRAADAESGMPAAAPAIPLN